MDIQEEIVSPSGISIKYIVLALKILFLTILTLYSLPADDRQSDADRQKDCGHGSKDGRQKIEVPPVVYTEVAWVFLIV